MSTRQPRCRAIERRNTIIYRKRKKPDFVIKNCYQYCYKYCQVSSFHGAHHLTALGRHHIEYVLWAACFTMGIVGTVVLSLQSWSRYSNFPTVNSMDRNYRGWNLSFPAILLCPHDKISTTKLQHYLDTFQQGNSSAKDFILTLANVNYNTLRTIPSTLQSEVPPSEYIALLYQLRYDLQFDTKANYGEVITEMGICHLFNSKPRIFKQFNSRRFLNSNETNFPHNKIIVRSFLDNGVVAVVANLNASSKIQYASPEEIATIKSPMYLSPLSSSRELNFEVLPIIYSPKIEALDPTQRKCRFHTETDTESDNIYSYNLCQMHCRQKLAIAKCHCSPHFYPKSEGISTCDLEGLRCLSRFQDILLNLKDGKERNKLCNCLPTCKHTVYYVKNSNLVKQWYTDTTIKWYLENFPRMRIIRELIFGIVELSVAIGGSAAFFLGCSVLSFGEIIYFFVVRLLIIVYGSRKNN